MSEHHNWGPTEWAAYIREAQGQAVTAITETGSRIRQAHDAYKLEPQRWGKLRWEKWAKDLGFSQATISMMESIAEEFHTSNNINIVNIISQLPASWGTLYQLAQVHRDAPEVFETALSAGRISPEMTRQQADALVAESKREQRRERESSDADAERAMPLSGVGWSLECCDFRYCSIEPGSVKLVLTDPPYALEYLDAYRDLPECAERWLADDGWLGVMVGQRHLPQIISALSNGPLEYVWTLCLSSSASRAVGIQFLKIQSTWKPLILLRKGNEKLREWTGDLISYEWQQKDGDIHKWQQDISPFQKIVRVMTEPGDQIADPFCGSGTTGVAALTTKRRFLGCDEDNASIQSARLRLDALKDGEDVDPTTGEVISLASRKIG